MTERISELLNMLRDESNCNVLDCLDEASDLIESLAAELEQVKRERDGLSIMLTAAESAAETHKRERDELDAKCRQMEARNDTLIAKEVLFDEAIATGAKMQRERDAAVEDVAKLKRCEHCIGYEEFLKPDGNIERCNDCEERSNW